MENAIVFSFVLIGLVSGILVSILGFLIIVGVWLAAIALATYTEVVVVNEYFSVAVISVVLAQVSFLGGAVISRKLRSLKSNYDRGK